MPLFRRLGQSAVLGYLAAGVIIGPSGLSLIADPETLLGVAELASLDLGLLMLAVGVLAYDVQIVWRTAPAMMTTVLLASAFSSAAIACALRPRDSSA